MNITVQLRESPALTALLQRGQDLSPVLEGAGRAVSDYLRWYHGKMDWKGSGWIPPSLGFAPKVVAGWQEPVVSGSRVTITNTFGLLVQKVRGGEIYPVRASMLAWPLVSEAKGKTVAQYRAGSSEPLFQAGMALCQRIGGRLTAIYALSKGVKQYPWPKAMPTDHVLGNVFTAAAKLQLTRHLTRAA